MTPQDTSNELAAQLGLQSLMLDDHQAFALDYPDGISVEVQFRESEGAVRLLAQLGKVRQSEQHGFLVGTLMGNTAMAETDQGHFAYEPAGGSVFLCKALPLETTTSAALAQELPVLVESARRFREQFAQRELIAL